MKPKKAGMAEGDHTNNLSEGEAAERASALSTYMQAEVFAVEAIRGELCQTIGGGGGGGAGRLDT